VQRLLYSYWRAIQE